MTIEIITFGYLHGAPPEAHLTLDLRHHFRDPHIDPALREMTAHDQAVRDAVLSTPGILALVDATIAAVDAYLSGPSAGPLTLATGCAGGRHRAVAVGAELHRRLTNQHPTTLTHRDLDKPVVSR